MQPNPFVPEIHGYEIDAALRHARVLRSHAFRDAIAALFGTPRTRDLPHRTSFWPEMVRCDLPFGPMRSTRS